MDFLLPILIALCAFLGLEILLRVVKPNRLWKDAFKEETVHEVDPKRGWKPKPNAEFDFHHRYLRGHRKVITNSLGLRSNREFEAQKATDVFRILFFGESTMLGWELPEDQTVYSVLERELVRRSGNFGKKIEIVPIVARNYSLGQLFTWYKEVFQNYDFDLLLYVFNENNPRRTITIHESGKPEIFTQPIYSRENGGLRLFDPPVVKNPNDMIYVDANNQVVVKRGETRNTPHLWLRDHLHLYCASCDILQGSVRLRNFKDRTEIKDIEKWNAGEQSQFPFQWEICREIFGQWIKEVKMKEKPFVATLNLQYYHAGNNWLHKGTGHPWGFNYEDIPSRKYLSRIFREANIEFLDIYTDAYENRVDTSDFYVHPRYAYYSPKGAEYQAKFIADNIIGFLN